MVEHINSINRVKVCDFGVRKAQATHLISLSFNFINKIRISTFNVTVRIK